MKNTGGTHEGDTCVGYGDTLVGPREAKVGDT